jgi:uncharacterized protein YwgA
MDFHRHALILAMVEKLRAMESRTGKTPIIKGLFLAKAAGLDVPFELFLYKHGPYSTDVEDNLDQMKSYGAIEVEPAFDGYGVRLSPGVNASFVKKQVSLSPEEQATIERVCRFICHKNVSQLERLATAAWIRKEEGIEDTDQVAKRLNQLKPHINLSDAREADREIMRFLEEEE